MGQASEQSETTTSPTGNGAVTWRWLLGVALALVFTFGGYAWKSTIENVSELGKSVEELRARVSQNETATAVQQVETRNLRNQLDRMEIKLDRLLEKP